VHLDVAGRPVHLAFSGRAVRDASGRTIGAHGSARDVTARIKVSDALERARAEAERAVTVRSAFLANMSHEIRTPMNGVLGMADLLLDSELDPQQRRSVDVIRSSAEALLALLNDVLDYSKLDAGRMTLEDTVFDLPALIDSAVRLLSARAHEKGIELNYVVAAGVPRSVRGDPGRIRQILNNLIGNAVKFTDQGEVLVTVSARTMDHGAQFRISVRDTGIGIAADKLTSIFDEFSQADMTTTRKFGGTGLGLTIVRRLARMMDGEVSVTSEPGKGSEFVCSVRLAVVAGTAAHEPVSSVGSLAGRRALVIDDNKTNRMIVRSMLRSAGVRVASVRSAASGMAALQRAVVRQRPFDVALLDAQMPVRDGFQLATDIRSDAQLRDTHLVMLTSGGTPGDGKRCRDLGIEGYLGKPFSRSELLDTVATVLSGSPSDSREPRLVTRHSINEARRRLRILVAEDNPVNQEVAVAMLRRRGHEVDIAADGQEAVDAVRSRPYDVVLMDLQMPVMDGLTATRVIRAMPEHAKLPIIALTAHALREERQRCLDAGMNDHLAKPFRPHELFAVIEQRAATTSPPADSSDSPAFGLDAFRAAMRDAGIEDALGSVLDTFLDDQPARLQAIESACRFGSASEIASAMHALKSSAATIGAAGLATLLQQGEKLAATGQADAAKALWPAVANAASDVFDELTRIRAAGPA
jgi:signal transduction histidine kinase/DNA-binding response OmpR family regulator